MARIRSIHPGLFTDEAFVSCQPLARLLLLGIWTECDDHGVFEWKPVTIKMKVMPADMADVPDLMKDLVAFDIIKKVTIDGKAYGLVRNFCRYQRPKWPTYRVPVPVDSYSYVGMNADGSIPNPKSSPSATGGQGENSTSAPETAPQRKRSRSRRGVKKEPSSNHIDKPVVVVPPRDPETPAGTTTTKVENDLAVQGEAPKQPSNPLGTALPETWIPDDDCIEAAHDVGMTDATIEDEVLRFHAVNAQRGTFSQNWNKTWELWCAQWKRHSVKETAKEAAKAPARIEVSAAYKPTPEQWDGAAKLYAQTGRWSGQLGPDPESPACRCPPDILEKHLPNPAAIPVLRARAAKVPA